MEGWGLPPSILQGVRPFWSHKGCGVFLQAPTSRTAGDPFART